MSQKLDQGLPVELLKKISKLYAINIQDLKDLDGIENDVYGFDRAKESFILRIGSTEHMSISLVRAEVDWVDYLGKNGVPVASPVASLNGRLVEPVQHEEKSYVVVCSTKLKGEHISMRDPLAWRDDLIIHWGQLVGRMHRATKEYVPSADRRYAFNITLPHIRRMLPHEGEETIANLAAAFKGLDDLPKDKQSYGLIPSDIHSGNFFVDGNEITGFFDFDRCCYKWFVSDIAVILFYPLYASPLKESEAKQKAFVRYFVPLFMRGYERENQLPAGWQDQIEMFLRVRDAILYMYCPPHLLHMRFPHGIMGRQPYLSVGDEIKDI